MGSGKGQTIVLWMLALVAAAPTSSPLSTRPATKKAAVSDRDRSAVRTAIAALTAEYDRAMRSPANNPLRTACDYFVEHPAGEISTEAITSVLVLPTSGDQRAAAYVRWQLLSGLPKTIDDATAKDLLKAFRLAPAPIPRLGMSQEDQQRLERITQTARQADEPEVLSRIEEIVSARARENAPILAYREELYRRSPKTLETFAAALDDLFGRTAAAADGKTLLKSFCADVKSWANEGDSPRPAMLELAKSVRRLADTKSPPYYDTPYWREKAGVFAWRKTRSDVDSGHALKDLAALLEEQARQPVIDPATIKIKDAPKDAK